MKRSDSDRLTDISAACDAIGVYLRAEDGHEQMKFDSIVRATATDDIPLLAAAVDRRRGVLHGRD